MVAERSSRRPGGPIWCLKIRPKIDPKIDRKSTQKSTENSPFFETRFKNKNKVNQRFWRPFFFWSSNAATASDFPGFFGRWSLKCLKTLEKSYFLFSLCRFLNPLNRKKKSYSRNRIFFAKKKT